MLLVDVQRKAFSLLVIFIVVKYNMIVSLHWRFSSYYVCVIIYVFNWNEIVEETQEWKIFLLLGKTKKLTREPRDYFHGSLKAGILSCTSFALVSSLPRNYCCNSRDECCFGVDIKKKRFLLVCASLRACSFLNRRPIKSLRKRHPATCKSKKISNYS